MGRAKYVLVFWALAVACVVAASQHDIRWLQLLEANVALAFAGVGAGYAGVGPKVFGKCSDGRLAWWSYAVYWPYFALNALSLWLFRRTQRENAFDQIEPNLWLGCRLWNRDAEELQKCGIQSTLDLTAEFSATEFLRRQKAYRCLPLLDTTAPSLETLRDGVVWMEERAAAGPLYVHCALGHGRSGMFVLAYLLKQGQIKDATQGLQWLQALRPGVDLHRGQLRLLEQWEESLRTVNHHAGNTELRETQQRVDVGGRLET